MKNKEAIIAKGIWKTLVELYETPKDASAILEIIALLTANFLAHTQPDSREFILKTFNDAVLKGVKHTEKEREEKKKDGR